MGSYRRSYKDPNMDYNYGYPTYSQRHRSRLQAPGFRGVF